MFLRLGWVGGKKGRSGILLICGLDWWFGDLNPCFCGGCLGNQPLYDFPEVACCNPTTSSLPRRRMAARGIPNWSLLSAHCWFARGSKRRLACRRPLVEVCLQVGSTNHSFTEFLNFQLFGKTSLVVNIATCLGHVDRPKPEVSLPGLRVSTHVNVKQTQFSGPIHSGSELSFPWADPNPRQTRAARDENGPRFHDEISVLKSPDPKTERRPRGTRPARTHKIRDI